MASFASVTELQQALQAPAVDSAAATLALDIASSAIRVHCGWSISEETVTADMDGDGTRSLWLPTLLLTAVASVSVGGESLSAPADYDWTSYGKLIRNGLAWPPSARAVTVVYTHGYNPVPDVVKGACLAAAVRAYTNPRGARNQEAGPYVIGFADGSVGGASLTLPERESLGRFQLEVVG